MLKRRLWIVIGQVVALGAFTVLFLARWFPLGIPGEWEWPRLKVTPTAVDTLLAAVAIALYAGFTVIGLRRIARASTRVQEGIWVLALFIAAVGVQIGVQTGAPEGYGLTKWVTLGMPGSNGYFEVARREISDPWRFWADYPVWIQRQDALHIGTHPPGLFLWARGIVGYLDANPGLARAITASLPSGIDLGFRTILASATRMERAAYATTGLLTLVACAGAVVPIYFASRAWNNAQTAWMTASLWPLLPSVVLFQPTADTAFPCLSAVVCALTAWSIRGAAAHPQRGEVRGRSLGLMVSAALSVFAGVVLGLGMQLSLVFLPIGLVVAIVIGISRSLTWRSRVVLFLATGLGFLVFTLGVWAISRANPFVIWWWNQKNHARFYVEYPRRYLAWVVVNPLELAIAFGIPVAVPAVFAFVGRKASAVPWATLLVLVLLDATGKNASEVARLWLPFMPGLLIASGEAYADGPSGRSLAMTLILLGFQTLLLQSTIQVVYPI